MKQSPLEAAWTGGEAYEIWMGRWNRPIARQFIDWLNVPRQSCWLDVGCGTGILTEAITQIASPRSVVGLDRSDAYIRQARASVTSPHVEFVVGDAQVLPLTSGSFDVAVSSLVLNFVPDPHAMVASMVRVTRSGGIVAAYVWDYLDGMEFLRYFWDAAAILDPSVRDLPEVRRYSLCRPEPLANIFGAAGLQQITVKSIEAPSIFQDFDDFWLPFLKGQGTAPTYVASLIEERRQVIRDAVRRILPISADGRILLSVRAWAVRGLLTDVPALTTGAPTPDPTLPKQ